MLIYISEPLTVLSYFMKQPDCIMCVFMKANLFSDKTVHRIIQKDREEQMGHNLVENEEEEEEGEVVVFDDEDQVAARTIAALKRPSVIVLYSYCFQRIWCAVSPVQQI